jgi:peptidoglycan/xylan/chitin deacetylase (PgdA/CDA1 family)
MLTTMWTRLGPHRLVDRARHLRARLSGGVVLCYHLVGADVGGPVDLDVSTFEEHLRQLSACDVRSLQDVVASGSGVALTFDDAFANFAEVVWPRLREARLPATLFVPTGFIDGTHGSPLSTAPRLAPCRWQDLRAMRREGLAIGSHSRTHRDLRRLDDDAIIADVGSAAARLREVLELDDLAFCYPQAKVSRAVEQIVRQTHRIAVVGGGTRVDPAMPWRVPRTSVVRGGPSPSSIVRWPVEPRELVADRWRQWR